jgi:hypothetical protein
MGQLEWTVLVGAAVAVACGTTKLDAGSNDRADAGEVKGHVYEGMPTHSQAVKCDVPTEDWLAGVWQGEFDSYALPSRSKAIRIDFAGSPHEPGGVCGTVVLGQGDPLPLPTDPTLPPPGEPPIGSTFGRTPREGFPYDFGAYSSPLLGVDGGVSGSPPIKGRRVRFAINLLQIYNAWCEMQPSYLLMEGMQYDPAHPLDVQQPAKYGCVPPGAIVTGGDGPYCDHLGVRVRYVSCAQAEYCTRPVCACNGPSVSADITGDDPRFPVSFRVYNGCGAAAPIATEFDLTVADDTMTGNVVFFDRVEPLHLTRSQ